MSYMDLGGLELKQIYSAITGFRELEKSRMEYQAHLMRVSTSWIINCNGMLKKGKRIKPENIVKLSQDKDSTVKKPKNLEDIFKKAQAYGPGKFVASG